MPRPSRRSIGGRTRGLSPELDSKYETAWKRRKDVFEQRWDSLDEWSKLRLTQDLNQLPDLKAAYFAFDRFKQIFDYGSPEKARTALREWEDSLPERIEQKFEDELLGAVREWREEILNYFRFHFKYTNAGTEGLNRAIKQIAAGGPDTPPSRS